MATAKKKWYLVGSVDRDWFAEPVEAEHEVEAIRLTETEGGVFDPRAPERDQLGNSWAVYELSSKSPKVFKTQVAVVPGE